MRGFARGIGPRRATVILEPDAIPQAVVESCLSAQSKAQRYALLARRGADVLKRRSNVAVYIDAGNPGFVRPAGAAGRARCAPPASRPPTASRST